MSFQPKAFKGKKACVIGLGRSGLACARLLARKGFSVLGSDSRPRAEIKAQAGRLPAAVAIEGGGHSERVLKCAFAVKSPGLPPSLEVFRRLKEAGVPVFSELEVALAFAKTKDVIAITGTNGKTTTATLTRDIFAEGLPRGRRALLCGNIGVPLSESVLSAGPKDTLIVESSSYQLEDSRFFQPKASAVLNVTADHLDHHGSMARYIDAKARAFRDQGAQDACVFNAQDPIVVKLSRRCRSRKLFFGHKGHVHAWEEGGRIHAKLPGQKKEAVFTPPKLPGRHNLENAMAAILLGLARGIKPAAVQKALKAFKGVEHRLEEAGTVGGLRCINDSKATNVDSTIVALRCLDGAGKNVLLILGGLHKGSPYTTLKPFLETTVKCVLTIGSAARLIEENLQGLVPIFPCGDLATAVKTARTVGSKGDILLLSPGCASFDQFRDYEDRGRAFKGLLK